MFHLFHGDDEFTNREQVRKLRQSGNFEYNQDTYDSTEADLATILITLDTMPFLTEQRLVIIEGLPKRKRGESTSAESDSASPSKDEGNEGTGTKGKKRGKKGGKSATQTRAGFEKALAEYIPTMPETTVLILLVDEVLDAANPLVKVASKHGKVIQNMLPKGAALTSWITKRAKSNGVTIASDANSLLANFIGNHLRLLANELDKLATYVGPGGTITIEHVRQLSTQVQEARIFDLTDALAQRNRTQALNILHELIADGKQPIYLIGTIISQVRTLLLVKDLAQKGMRSAQIASMIGSPPFVVDKAYRQVGNFSMAQLENAYRQLMTTDAALKRSRIEPEMALDLLIVNFGVK
ncbi:MAG TPA: DNA polymerase III subunit delta [Ktedonobacter sp.]|nr:DNA polymerase III subunit delta [Ktedonobacter sp.]